MEKCKLCSRVGESIKIKLSRVCDSAWFAIFVYICWFMTGCMYLFHNFVRFSTFVSPLGLHFSTHLQWCWPSISMTFFNQNIQIKAESCGGHLWHILGKGGTGSHLGAFWDPFGDSWQDGGWRGIWRPDLILCASLSNRMQKLPSNFNFTRDFEGTINYDCIFTVRYERRLFAGSRLPIKGPLPRPWEPH